MKIVQEISQHKRKLHGQKGGKGKRKIGPLKPGYRRIEAIVLEEGCKVTRHFDVIGDFKVIALQALLNSKEN
jgi:hypothetical protein